MDSFWRGFDKHADQRMEARRRALSQVKDILAPHGDFFAVSEGASVSRTSKPGIIKDLRLKLMDYERSVGQDPEHDWSKRASDTIEDWKEEDLEEGKKAKGEKKEPMHDPMKELHSMPPDSYWRSWP